MKQFRSFRLDTANHCLWSEENRVSLTPKAFDVLRYLVEHPGRLVTQDEILEALWPEAYVNPELIKKYILGIRKVLGDSPDKPVFIETFPKRGYQFVAPVSDESTAGSSDSPSDSKKMVGRDMALTKLNAHLDAALRGQRQLIFVTGEAGIGKTTLVDVFHLWAARRPNMRVARGQCVEGFGGKEAYYPMLEALGQLVRDADSNPIAQTLAKRAPTWWIQFPSLVKAEKKEALQREILGATRERMVREICEALEAITADNPLVLIFEDLHWVDDSTLDLISALARRREPAKLMLLGTYRPADVILSKTPLKGLKQDLQLHQLCTEIALECLEEPAIAEYLATEFPTGNLPAGLAKLIYRHSGGNALFMAAIVQDMVKKCVIAQDRGRWKLTQQLEDIEPGVPETLQQMLEVQFDQLSSAQQRVLRSASVAGERFSVWAITTALDNEGDQIEDLCEELAEKQQFLNASGIHELGNVEFSAHYEFRHSLYRQAIYKRLSEGSRSKLHRALGQRLKACYIPGKQETASEIALHLELGHEYEQAIHYLWLTAENAARRFAHRDSIQVLRHALKLVPKVAAGRSGGLEIQILQSIGDAHCALGDFPDAVQSYETAAVRAAPGLKRDQVNALWGLARAAAFINGDRGIAVCEQALRVSADYGDPLLLASAQMLAASFRLLYDGWRTEDAELCASANLAICRLSESGLPAYHEMMYSHVQSLRGNYREALEKAEAGTPKAAESANLMVYLAALSGKVFACLHLGQLGEVLRIVLSGKEMAEKNENNPWLSIFRSLECWLRTLAFDFRGARQLSKAIIPGSTTEDLSQAPELLAMVFGGQAELMLGEPGQALHNFETVLKQDAMAKSFLHWYWRTQAKLGLARTWLALGNFAHARIEAESFLKCAMSTADPNLQALAWEMKARVAIAEQDWTLAGSSIQAALAILQEREVPLSAWRVHATAWEFYRLQKNDESAERHRAQAEAGTLAIAGSFPEQEPLREIFLAADPVSRILVSAAAARNVARREEKVG